MVAFTHEGGHQAQSRSEHRMPEHRPTAGRPGRARAHPGWQSVTRPASTSGATASRGRQAPFRRGTRALHAPICSERFRNQAYRALLESGPAGARISAFGRSAPEVPDYPAGQHALKPPRPDVFFGDGRSSAEHALSASDPIQETGPLSAQADPGGSPRVHVGRSTSASSRRTAERRSRAPAALDGTSSAADQPEPAAHQT